MLYTLPGMRAGLRVAVHTKLGAFVDALSYTSDRKHGLLATERIMLACIVSSCQYRRDLVDSN